MTRTAAFLATALGALWLASLCAVSPAADAIPRLDVVFVIDTTGSMGDEIQVVKEKVRDMVAKIASGKPTPQARFGLVLYRDRGDQYVTKMVKLTDDVDALVEDIKAIEAGGGGDYPESLVEALHVTVSNMNWDPSEQVDKTAFVICDAPPHLDYKDDFDYKKELSKALELGIIIHVIGCSGLNAPDAEFLEKSIARAAEGTYNPLTYRRMYATEGGGTVSVLETAGKTYALKDGVATDSPEWRKGGDRLAAAGATVAGPVAAAAPVMPGATPGVVGMVGPAGPAGARVAPGGAVAQIGATENNLDSILVRVVQRQAEAKGVEYVDTGQLDILARFEGTDAAGDLAGERVIREGKAFDALWKSLHAGKSEAPLTPKVDFDKNMVLALFAGEKPSGGYLAHIDTVRREGDGLKVAYWLREPPAGSTRTLALTHPYSIVVTPILDADATWLKIGAPDEK